MTELNGGGTPSTVKVNAGDINFDAVVRIDTPGEADYYRNGGIMQYVLRSLIKKHSCSMSGSRARSEGQRDI